jgi:hypothetical protein
MNSSSAVADIGKACFYLATWPLLPQHNRTALIVADNIERVLAYIDPDYGDCADPYRDAQSQRVVLPRLFAALRSSLSHCIYIAQSLIGINAGSFGGEIMSGRTP